MEPRGGTPFHRYDYSGKLALVVAARPMRQPGNRRRLRSFLTIPMGGQESLNAAMAATWFSIRQLSIRACKLVFPGDYVYNYDIIFPGGGCRLRLAGFFWRLFELTGFVSAYMIYKKLHYEQR